MTGPRAVARRVVRSTIRLGLRSARLRRIVQAELGHGRAGSTVATPPPASLPPFVDDRGIRHELDPSHRDRLKPAWRVMCDAEAVSAMPTDEAVDGRARKATQTIDEMTRVLGMVASVRPKGRILEVGCYDGTVALAAALDPAVSAVGSDLARYYVVQRPGEPEAAQIAAEADRLAALRERARVAVGTPPERIAFIEDDITATTLEPGSFDLVMSFEVLEHVADPAATFASIARLLRPGGVTYHVYNPFFSQIGGHSLVTLDFPWGHARLTPAEVERYLRTIRPAEADQALRFYRESLNRMTLADLDAAIDGAGLERLAVIPWCERALIGRASPESLDEVRRSAPGATLGDLLATFVTVVARRPR